MRDIENSLTKSIVDILNTQDLSATNKSKMIENLWAGAQAQINSVSGVDKNFAKAASGALANYTPFVTNTLKDLAPWVDMEAAAKKEETAAAAPAGPITINLSPVFNLSIDGDMDALKFRDELMPELIAVIESGVRGYRERLSQLLQPPTTATTPAVSGI